MERHEAGLTRLISHMTQCVLCGLSLTVLRTVWAIPFTNLTWQLARHARIDGHLLVVDAMNCVTPAFAVKSVDKWGNVRQ